MKYNYILVTIGTVNFDQLVNFYMQLLESPPIKFIPSVYVEWQVDYLRLGIFRPQKDHESEFVVHGKNPLSLCIEVSNLENAISDLKSLGYPPTGEISTTSHGQEIYAQDPDGNRLILYSSSNIDKQCP